MQSVTRRSVVVLLVLVTGTVAYAMPQSERTVSYDEALADVREISLSVGSVDVDVLPARGVPRVEADLSVNTGSSEVAIEDVGFASFVLRAGSGDVRVERSSGRMEFWSGSGDVTIHDVDGSVYISTGSGDASLRNVSVLTAFSSGSGELAGDGVSVDRTLTVDASSGDVNLGLDHDADEISFRLSARSGDLRVNDRAGDDRLRVGDGPITIDATTGSGDQTYRTR